MSKWLVSKIKLIAIVIMAATGMTIPGWDNANLHYMIFFGALLVFFACTFWDDDKE